MFGGIHNTYPGWKRELKIKITTDVKKNKFTISIFFTPDDHKIINSLSFMCFKIKIVMARRKDRGINLGAIPNKFKRQYRKYVLTG